MGGEVSVSRAAVDRHGSAQGKPGTYLKDTTGHQWSSWTKELPTLGRMEQLVTRSRWRVSLAEEHIRTAFGVEWHNCRLLDVGAGQLLRQALLFATRNSVVAVDLELPFRGLILPDFFRTWWRMGSKRAIRTLARQAMGFDRRFRRELRRQCHIGEVPPVELHRMDATRLDFPDASFDGVFSFSTYQYIGQPEMAAGEVFRVLKPGGIAYIDLHLYTSLGGSDHPFIWTAPDRMPPWGHLRPSTAYYSKHGTSVNRWRMGQWKQMLETVFPEVRCFHLDGEREAAASLLTPEIRQELAAYTEEELLTTTFVAVCRKGSA